jgi:hypothetical protein
MGPRIGLTTFGAGFGAGMAYTQCRYKFEKNGRTFFENQIDADVEVKTTTSNSNSSHSDDDHRTQEEKK